MSPARTLDLQIARVVGSGNCSGCGACCELDPGLRMALSPEGYSRPTRDSSSVPVESTSAFDDICPGRSVSSPRPPSSTWHPTMGPIVSAFQGSAADAEIRFAGSSGGALTALITWLIDTGRAPKAVAAAADPDRPSRTVTTRVHSRADALAAAGSRYGPVSNASAAEFGQDVVFVGKPCEVSAVRAAAARTGRTAPILLSFFCAGTPSQTATDQLVERLIGDQRPVAMWYRGRGWPGQFTVVTSEGETAGLSYEESWGKALGPAAQWRCKICVDGIGESADIVAADFWESDESGYPVFDEGAGVSALLARTPLGADLLQAAIADGVLDVAPLDPDALAEVQPFQVQRRTSLAARLIGARAAGRAVPSYRGFGLWRHLLRNPYEQLRTARGTFRRVRSGRAG